ncbi:MAG: 2OG-Fe(II) oxygenase [Pseudomonadota bacterium]
MIDINFSAIKASSKNWRDQKPFPHFIVDNFFPLELAKLLESEFPDYTDDIWHTYGNAIEMKKACNNWNAFPSYTYRVFQYLNSLEVVSFLSQTLFNGQVLYADNGLNGGGWHIHGKGGKLNTHLDYSIHPKLKKQRKLNIIIYMNSSWKPQWGGSLGLWSHESAETPGKLVKEIEPVFNRAVIFDTTCNSWHGLPNPLTCPQRQYRKSLAIYYLTDPPEDVDERGKALFAPAESQKDDQAVLELIRERSNVKTAKDVYRKK